MAVVRASNTMVYDGGGGRDGLFILASHTYNDMTERPAWCRHHMVGAAMSAMLLAKSRFQ